MIFKVGDIVDYCYFLNNQILVDTGEVVSIDTHYTVKFNNNYLISFSGEQIELNKAYRRKIIIEDLI